MNALRPVLAALLLTACDATPSPVAAPATPSKAVACGRTEECGTSFRCNGVQEREGRAVPATGRCEEAECHGAHGSLAARTCGAGHTCTYEDGFAVNLDLGACLPAP